VFDNLNHLNKILFNFQDDLEVVSTYDVQKLNIDPTKTHCTMLVHSVTTCGEACLVYRVNTLVHSTKTCGETIFN
jgi:hypothetical protein